MLTPKNHDPPIPLPSPPPLNSFPPNPFPFPPDLKLCLPDSLQHATPYIVQEQNDWFEDELQFLRAYLKPGMNTLDVGANYGIYGLTAARLVGETGLTFLVEPTPDLHPFLEESITQNHLPNAHLIKAALTRASGETTLFTSPDVELNTLSPPDPSTLKKEKPTPTPLTVPALSLEDLLTQLNHPKIDVIKIDAEGEELAIFEGARTFFQSANPLVLFEVRTPDGLNLDLARQLLNIDYHLYRYIRPLHCLAPVNLDKDDLDPYCLNLFACKATLAQNLAKQNLLVRTEYPNITPIVSHAEALADFPYWKIIRPSFTFEVRPAKNEYHLALDCFCSIVQTEDPDTRWSLARRAHALARHALEKCDTFARRLTLARIAFTVGARQEATTTLRDIIKAARSNHPLALDEPFLPACPRFDTIDPASKTSNWVLAAVSQQYERIAGLSSFFSGTQSLEHLEYITQLGFEDPEMPRRANLIRKRFSLCQNDTTAE
ncbi:MAG: FkbM family methyltransferase [Verrucomicrobiota bacterium]